MSMNAKTGRFTQTSEMDKANPSYRHTTGFSIRRFFDRESYSSHNIPQREDFQYATAANT